MGSGRHGPEPPAPAPALGPEPAAPAGGWPAFAAAEVARHCTVDDAWVAVAGSVYDITAFASTHPGWYRAGKVSTALAIARNLGQDCTEEFAHAHPAGTLGTTQLPQFKIGVLRPAGEGSSEEREEEGGPAEPPPRPVPAFLREEVDDFSAKFENGISKDTLEFIRTSAGNPLLEGLPSYFEEESDHEREAGRRRAVRWRHVGVAALHVAAALGWTALRVARQGREGGDRRRRQRAGQG